MGIIDTRIVWLKERTNYMKIFQDSTIPNFWLATKSFVQGLQPKEDPDDSTRGKIHYHQDEGVEWHYGGCERVGCLCTSKCSIHIENLFSYWCGSYAPNPTWILVGFWRWSYAKFHTIGDTLFLMLFANCSRWMCLMGFVRLTFGIIPSWLSHL